MGKSRALNNYIPENVWTRVGLKVLFRNPSIWESLLALLNKLFIGIGYFKIEIFRIVYLL